jgi:autotransporter-associated beta strand protein
MLRRLMLFAKTAALRSDIYVGMLACGISLSSLLVGEATASVVFDFDSGPVHASLPLDQTAGGITAHFAATGQGFSTQPLPVVGLWPVGFSGNCLYPNSVFASDLLIAFSKPLSDISLQYSPEEYGTDTSCTMRITAYNGTSSVGTTTYSIPGDAFTWPTGTLAIAPTQSFNNVVVHYQAAPVSGGDYGPVFMVDNVNVTPVPEPAVAYWKGTHDGAWSTLSPSSNWVATADGTDALGALPGTTTDVYFSAADASNLATTLGADFAVHSVNFAAGIGPVTIGGGNSLSLSNGVTVASGSASHTVDANVNLDANQTWLISGTNTLTVNGQISGSAKLSKDGPGALILSGSNIYSGGTSVLAGTLIVSHADGLLNGSSLTVGAGASAIFGGAVLPQRAAPVPEPGTLLLLVAGAVLSTLYRKRRQRSNRDREGCGC